MWNNKQVNTMKTNTDYQNAKAFLKMTAKTAKSEYKNDKPAQKMIINDTADYLCKNYQFSEYKRNLLSLYACKLHPKN